MKVDGTPAIQMKDMTFISEAGLYQAIFMSRKPNAQKFTLWVTNEVLPMIRKTGGVRKKSRFNLKETSSLGIDNI